MTVTVCSCISGGYCVTGTNVIDIHFTFTRDGRPSGEAYIELASEQDVVIALSKNQQHMGKRYIEGIVTVFCVNLPAFCLQGFFSSWLKTTPGSFGHCSCTLLS